MSDADNKHGPQGKGWADARPKRPEAFFRVEEGAFTQGVLKGRFAKPGNRKGYVYQLVTTVPCIAMVRDEEKSTKEKTEYMEEEVPAGTLLSIDERKALESLKDLVDDPENEWEVYLKAIEKRKLDNGNTFWDFDVQKRPFIAPF